MTSRRAPIISLCGIGQRALAILERLADCAPDHLAHVQVVTAYEKQLVDHDTDRLIAFCQARALPCVLRRDEASLAPPDYFIAVGWHWMINATDRLVILHDSLLPRYRGFAPVTSALLNRDPHLGVTALLGSAHYDRGDILGQASMAVAYPCKLQHALDRMLPLYQQLGVEVVARMVRGEALLGRPQNEQQATYSVWRDAEDYRIDWHASAEDARLHIDATGPPYRGASTMADGHLLRVLEATPMPDVVVENRCPGKVLFVEEGRPVVICGRGLLRLDDLRDEDLTTSMLPLRRFRTRFR